MDISKFKIVFKYLFGGIGSVVDYLLGILNAALAKIDPAKKDQIQGILNLARRVLSSMESLGWLCPTKWQTAYAKTIEAVETLVDALEDLEVTPEEFEKIKEELAAAIAAWKGDDDETCVDCVPYDIVEAA